MHGPWELPAAGSLAELAIIVSAVRFRQAGSIFAGGVGGLEAAAAPIGPGAEEKSRETEFITSKPHPSLSRSTTPLSNRI